MLVDFAIGLGIPFLQMPLRKLQLSYQSAPTDVRLNRIHRSRPPL